MTVTTRSMRSGGGGGGGIAGINDKFLHATMTKPKDDTASMTATESCSSVSSNSISSSNSNSSTTSSCSGSDTEPDDNNNDHPPFAATSARTKSTPTTTSSSLRRRRGGENVAAASASAHEGRVATGTTTDTDSKTQEGVIHSSTITTTTTATAYTPLRWVEVMIGSMIFFGTLPVVFVQIVSCTLWELLDQHTVKVTALATRFNVALDPILTRFVHHPKDGFIVNTTVWLGVVLPSYFCYEAYTQYTSLRDGTGFLWYRAALYNMIRIGPMYRHFMYVYVLCHKEAHSYGKLFSEPHNTSLGLKYIYNYFIGFFHGVLPGPFTESHIYNHHKYDNSVDDVYSTGAYPRDSFVEYLRYVYVWFLYALNLSSIHKFYQEGKFERVGRCLFGSLYYSLGVAVAWRCIGHKFALVYIVYPLIEGNILLSAVNYTWHAFIDPTDHDNDYVNSVTILDGLSFTLDEEYHVVHHQYGGVHWSKNKELYLKHIDEYKKCTATIFKECNLFVIWGMIVAKDYEGLTDHYVQLDDDETKHLSKQDLAQLLKERLQCTTWSY